jgi:hypothetical protein
LLKTLAIDQQRTREIAHPPLSLPRPFLHFLSLDRPFLLSPAPFFFAHRPAALRAFSLLLP